MQLRFLHELGTENSRHLTFYLAVQPMPNANKHHFSCPLRTAGLPKLITSSITSWKNCPSRDQVNNLIGFTVNNVYVVWLSIKLCYNQKSAWDLEKSVKKNLWLRMSSRNLGAWDGVEGKCAYKYWVKIKMCCSLSEKWEFYPIILHVQNVYLLNQNFREKR